MVRGLAVAWKNLAAYPPGHPALAGAVEAAHRKLMELGGAAGEVVFGISSQGILYGDETIESSHVQKLAQALYTRSVAVVRFGAETTAGDLETFLRLLGTGVPGEQKAPLWEQLLAAGVTNIELQPVDYSAVQVTDRLEEEEGRRRETLWDEILRALISGKELSAEERRELDQPVRSVDELSTLVLRYLDDAEKQARTAFDPDATFGVKREAPAPVDTPELLASRVAESIALHIGESTGSKKQLGVQQVLQLLRSMPDPIRATIMRAVLRVLSTDETAGPLLRDFTAELPNEEVVDSLRYLATITKLSSHAMRLLQTLAVLETPEVETQAPPPELLAELVNLFGEDDVDRFNPPDHRALLDHVSVRKPPLPRTIEGVDKLGDRLKTISAETVERYRGRTMLDLLERFGAVRNPAALLKHIEDAFASHLRSGSFDDALALIKRLQEIERTASRPALRDPVATSIARLATPETISNLVEALLSAPPEKMASIQRLTEALGASARRSLLTALANEPNRSRRRRLFDFIASLGPAIVPEVSANLADSRWFVVRNMIVLLRTVQDRTTLPEIRNLARHGDLRVRLEAIKTLLAFDSEVPSALLETAINDPDPKLAETAVALVGNYGIKEGVGPLLQILARTDLFGTRRPLRIRAIKALGELAEPRALQSLEKFFTDSILPWPAKEERRAAYESLAAYPGDARAPFVQRGLRSRDPEVREICRKLWVRE